MNQHSSLVLAFHKVVSHHTVINRILFLFADLFLQFSFYILFNMNWPLEEKNGKKKKTVKNLI